jgi:hypothetical protein
MARAREYLRAGNLELGSLVSGRESLAGLAGALNRLRQGEGIPYAIDPWA